MVLKLKTKILLAFVGIVAVSSLITAGIAVYGIQLALTNELVQRLVVNTKAEINAITNFVLIGDKEGIITSIYNQKSSHKDVAYLMVLDEGGQVIASTFINQDPNRFIGANALPEGLNQQVTLVRTEAGREVYDIALRLDYDKGVLRAGYFKQQIDQSVTAIVYLLLLGVGISLIVAVLFSFFFTRRFFKPLENLKSAVAKVSSGDLSAKATVTTRDELGFLALTFNDMTDR
jgi:nitrogen fixation/metabolism regulation signal transduction histidine kinase